MEWLIRPGNLVKVIEGNYSDQDGIVDAMQEAAAMAKEIYNAKQEVK